jgi:hypothetical protein
VNYGASAVTAPLQPPECVWTYLRVGRGSDPSIESDAEAEAR